MDNPEHINKLEHEPRPEIIIRAQTAKEEFEYLREILDIPPFFAEHNYKLVLPEDPSFKQPINPGDLQRLMKIFEENEYNPDFFSKGLEALEQYKGIIEATLPTLITLNQLWEFKIFPKYDLTFTRYGPGGMYYPETGKVIMQVDEEGRFKRGHPAHTPIHEMVHMGIEEKVIRKFGLDYWEKERVVDLMVFELFGEALPGYRIQTKGDDRVNPYVTKETIYELPSAIQRYVSRFPRVKA